MVIIPIIIDTIVKKNMKFETIHYFFSMKTYIRLPIEIAVKTLRA